MKWLFPLVAASMAHADPLPIDPAIVSGTLANGVRYAIGHADAPSLEIVSGDKIIKGDMDALHAAVVPGRPLAVIALVSGDPVVAQHAIEKKFADLPSVPAFAQRGHPAQPQKTVVSNASPARIVVVWSHAIAPRDTTEHLREFLVFQLTSLVLHFRSNRWLCKKPFVGIAPGSLQLICDIWPDRDGATTLDAVAHAIGDLRTHGFTADDLAPMKEAIAGSHRDAAFYLESWFTDGDVPMASAARTALTNKLLAGITPDDVNAQVRALGTPALLISGDYQPTPAEADARFAEQAK